MRQRSVMMLGMIVAACLLSGCGQKGPLYLPPARPHPVPAPSTKARPVRAAAGAEGAPPPHA